MVKAIHAIRIAHAFLVTGTLAAVAGLTATTLNGQAPSPPSPPSPPVISPSDPADAVFPSGTPNAIEFFDDFSWQMFLTMVWPADPARRGQPDLSRPLGAQGPLVFETFRANWEVFQPGGAAPAPFDTDAAVSPPCADGASPPPGALVLIGFTPYDEFRLAGFGPLEGPLPTQLRTYTRYATGYNRTQYDHITDEKLYLKASAQVPFPNGATMVKSSWIEMTGRQDPARYYTRQAWVRDPVTGKCAAQVVGLVGLHIVKKTPNRLQWIWSTFEHVDTAPDQGVKRASIYNDGSGTPMAGANPTSPKWPASPVPPTSPADPKPYNVERIKPIHASTSLTNKAYQQALAAKQPWQNYRLVMTQWPLQRADPNGDGKPANTFPGSGATNKIPNDSTAFANTTMEPFEQKFVAFGCMACHNKTRATDFVWAIAMHAWSPAPKPDSKAVRKLRRLKSDSQSR